MARHFRALVPGQCAPRLGRQAADLQVMGATPVGQVDEPDVSAGAIDERADGGAVCPPGDEIALPVTDAGSFLDDVGR